MNISQNLAKHYKEAYRGENWSWSELESILRNMDWKFATRSIYGCNSIAILVAHITYFNLSLTQVLSGRILMTNDVDSFHHPTIQSDEEWIQWIDSLYQDIDKVANLIEKVPNETWDQDFSDNKYGSFYRNVMGIIEHIYYHSGQIALLSKILPLV